MSKNVNKVRNAAFDQGQRQPAGWSWTGSRSSTWQRPDADGAGEGVIIHSRSPKGRSAWSQVVVCKPKTYYRVEATVSCDLSSPGDDGTSGVMIEVVPIRNDQPFGAARRTPGLLRSTDPIDIRTYYQTDDEVRRLKLSVVLEGASGTARIHQVRVIQILDPDLTAHPPATPPPAHTLPVPRVADSVCVCSTSAAQRPITARLSAVLGSGNAGTLKPDAMRPDAITQDAILLPDRIPPRSLRSLRTLFRMAEERLVIISLPAFARLAGEHLSLRRVEQDDDPIHARVVYANHATSGFALHDIFPYAWPGKKRGSFVQNQFRKTGSLQAFCKKHKLITLLDSMCDRDVTSERPVCLYRETERGGLFVLDIEPAEAPSSTFGEPTLALYLLLSILGRTQCGLGQFTVPANSEAELRDMFRDAAVRFQPFHVHDSGLPVEEVTEQLVTLGAEDATFGLPITPKPVILVRSGLVEGDAESVYGAFQWFKQLVRSEPHVCPYARSLAGQFRLAWIPCANSWRWGDGWRREPQQTIRPFSLESEDARVEAFVDMVSRPIRRARVVIPRRGGTFDRLIKWLPRVASAFPAGCCFGETVDAEAPFTKRDGFVQPRLNCPLDVTLDRDAFPDEVHRETLKQRGLVLRLELPGSEADFVCHSIQRTDLAATLLEQVIGLIYGLIAVNRSSQVIRFDGFPPVAPGEMIIKASHEPLLRTDATRAG